MTRPPHAPIRVRDVDLRTGASIADFPLTFRGCEGRLLSVENVPIDLRAGRIIGAPAAGASGRSAAPAWSA
ncbi:hypothetical protein [Nonomuraea bangladeshensis]|uniref:hypothetical protein n=1 Tax=Nonomuraea bangladeshensis TaxID=404385 RepID=UPI003C2BA2BE